MSEKALAKILLVEDDEAIGLVVADTLQVAGYHCETVQNGFLGLQQANLGIYDLLVVDINLPELSGLDLCRQFKQRFSTTPLIFLTARTDESDVIAGLELGADDYVTKPFRSKELLARIRARLREKTDRAIENSLRSISSASKNASAETAQTITIGELCIDIEKMRIAKNGSLLDLTAREFEVILLLAQNAGRPFYRDELLTAVWGVDAQSYELNVNVFVSRVRKKIEDDAMEPRYLLTVRGIGYRFVEPSELTSDGSGTGKTSA